MPITQSDIARHLGINQKSVSIAFGAAGRIGAETRRRILQVADELGYRTNHLAAGLRGARTRSVGVIWAFVDPWAGDAIIGLDVLERLQRRGFAVYQAQRCDDKDLMIKQIDDFLARRVDAIVIQSIPAILKDPGVVARLKLGPAVAIAREPIPGFEADLVVHDRNLAIRQLVQHLARTGRKRPMMAMDYGQESNPPKFEVFTGECRAHGIAVHDHMLLDTGTPVTSEQHGEVHRRAFRARYPEGTPIDVDAIFCFNDIGALAIMRELQERGIRIPQDIAVIGFNNTEAGSLWRPELATGDRKFRLMAETVDRILADRLATPDSPPKSETVHCEFVWRESAG